MARKRKLNKRVILVLSILGGLVLVAGGAAVMVKYLPQDALPELQAAEAAVARGDLTEAEKRYTKALGMINDLDQKADTCLKLAQVQWSMREREEFAAQARQKASRAYANVQAALTYNRNLLPARTLLVDMAYESGQWPQFVKEASELLKTEPDNHDLHFRLVTVRAGLVSKDETTQVHDIIRQFQELTRKANQPDYYTTFAAFLDKVQKYGDPSDVYAVGIQQNPRSGQLAVNYGLYLRNKNQAQALLRVNQLPPLINELSLLEKERRLTKLQEDQLEEARQQLKEARQQLDEIEMWLDKAKKLAEDDAEEVNRLRSKATELTSKATELAESDAEEANRLRSKATELTSKATELADNNVVSVWTPLANLAMMQGKYDDALVAAARIKEVADANPNAYILEGRIHAMRREMPKAVDAYRAGLAAIRNPASRPQSSDTREARARAANANRMRQQGRIEMQMRLGEALLDYILYDAPAGPERKLSDKQRQDMVTEANVCLEQVAAAEGAESYGAYSIKGRLALVENDLPAATEALQAAFDKAGMREPDTATWLYRAYVAHQRPTMGETVLKAFWNANKLNPQANLMLAQHYLGNRDPLQAEPYNEAVLRVDPTNTQALRNRQTIALFKGGDMTTEIDLDATSITMLNMRLQQMFAQGQVPQAVALVEQLYHQDETNVALFNVLTNLYIQTNQVDKAKALMAALKAQKPDDEKLQGQLDMNLTILSETDPDKRYELMLKQLEAQVPDDPVALNLSKSNLAAQMGKKEDRVAFLRIAETAGPDNPNVIAALFNYVLSIADFERAQTYADKAAANNIDKCDGLKFQAFLLQAQKRTDESLDVLEQALVKLPADKSLRAMAGESYLVQGNTDKAREHFLYLTKSDAGFFPGNFGMAKLTEGDPALRTAHMEFVRRCRLAQPNHPDVRNWVLILMEQDGQLAQTPAERDQMLARVIAERDQISKQTPDDVRNLMALARLYEQANRRSDTVSTYQELLKRLANPLPAADQYCRYLMRSGQGGQVYTVMQDLMSDRRVDRVMGFMLFGELLAEINPVHARSAYQQAIDEGAKTGQDARPRLAMGRFLAVMGARAASAGDPAAALEFDTEALDCYEQWFTATPAAAGSDEEYRLLALRVRVGQVDQARIRLEEILREKAADTDDKGAMKDATGYMKAQFSLAELYRAQQDDAKALEIYDSVVNLNPTLVQPLMVRSTYYQDTGDLPLAQIDVERAHAMDDSNTSVAHNLAFVLLKQHKYEQAIAVLNDVLSKDRTYQPAADLLLNAYIVQRNWPNVRTQIQLARARAAANRDLGRQIELHIIEAQMYRETGELRRSLASMDTALTLSKDDPRVLMRWLAAHVDAKEYDKVIRELRTRTGEAYQPLRLYEAAALLGNGNVADANALLTELVKNARGELPIILEYIGKHYKPADGLAAARQWVEMRDESLTNLFLGDMLVANKDIIGAEQAYRKGLSQSTTVGEKVAIHTRIGQMLYNTFVTDRERRDLLPKSVDAWLAVLELDKNNVGAMNNLAYMYTDDLDDPAQALPHALGAANRNPNSDILDTLGWTKARLAALQSDPDQRSRDLAAAVVVLKQAYDLETQLNMVHSVTISYHLGWTYEQLGDANNAMTYYRFADAALKDNERDPLYGAVKDALNRMTK